MVLWPWEYFVESVVLLANGHVESVVVLASRHVESDELEVVDWEVVVVVAVVVENVMEVEKQVEKQVELQVEQVQYFELDITQNAVWMYCL